MGLRASRHPLASLGLLAGVFVTLLMACQPSSPSALAKNQTLRMMWSNATGAPDPIQTAGTPAMVQFTNLLYDSLVTLDGNDQIEPWGASSWTISPDGLTYTFTLRPNQRFSDGAPVRASDYAWSINRALSPCLPSGFTDYFSPIKDAATFSGKICNFREAQGAIQTLVSDSIIPNDITNTLTIILARPAGYFLAQLASTPFFVLEQSVVLADIPGDIPSDDLGGDGAWTRLMSDGKTGQGGSGMFYLASAASAAYEPGAANVLNKLVFKPNPHWWGQRAGKTPHFSQVEMLSGDLDAFLIDDSIAYADRVDFQTLQQNPAVRRQPYYHEQPLYWVLTLEFNWKKAPFDDLNARKAFCLAINRAQFNQQVYPGVALPGWHLIPQGMPGYNPALNGLDGAPATGDTALARRSWQAYLAAHPGPAPQVTIVVQSGSSLFPIMNALAQGWRDALGVDASVYVPGMIILPEPASQQMSALNMGLGYADPHYAFPEDYTARLGVNVPAADALLRRADALAEMPQRILLYQQAEQLYVDNVGACPLFQLVAAYVQRSWVTGGFVEDGRGVFPNDAWVTGYIARH